MIVGIPYWYIIKRSTTVSKVINSLTSEQWSFIGFTLLLLTPLAALLEMSSVYALLLFGHNLCDINDGYVYVQKEKGILNGYGLYIDHMLDSIGAGFVAYGTYRFLDTPMACIIGLSLYYLIAIHSWLYKINMLVQGKSEGVYYAVTVSAPKRLWLNVDDLTLFLAIAVLTNWKSLLYLIDLALIIVLIVKFSRASLELRKRLWHSVSVSTGTVSDSLPEKRRSDIVVPPLE